MKKFIFTLFVVMLIGIMFFSACGGAEPAPTSAPAPAPAPVPAQTPEEFYKGKIVTFYIPAGPGAGLDTTARLLTPYLEKHTGATIVAVNQQGGGYTIPINYLYEKAEPDGLSISMIDTGVAVVAQLFQMENCRFDLREMHYIANVCQPIMISAVRPDSPYQSVADLLATKKQVVALATGPNTQTGIIGKVVLGPVLGIPSKVVTGYDAAASAYKGVIQKEGDISMGLYEAAAGFIKAGDLKVAFVTNSERYETLPDAPTVYEELEKLGKLTPEAKFWLDTGTGMFVLSRGIITAPGVPAERLNYLREAATKAIAESGFQSSMNKLGSTLYPLTGEETQNRVGTLLNMDPSKVEQLKKLIQAE